MSFAPLFDSPKTSASNCPPFGRKARRHSSSSQVRSHRKRIVLLLWWAFHQIDHITSCSQSSSTHPPPQFGFSCHRSMSSPPLLHPCHRPPPPGPPPPRPTLGHPDPASCFPSPLCSSCLHHPCPAATGAPLPMRLHPCWCRHRRQLLSSLALRLGPFCG